MQLPISKDDVLLNDIRTTLAMLDEATNESKIRALEYRLDILRTHLARVRVRDAEFID